MLLPYGISFHIGSTRGHSAPNIVDSRCAVYWDRTSAMIGRLSSAIFSTWYLWTGMSAHFSHTVSQFNIGGTRRHSAPNIVDSRCAVYWDRTSVMIDNYLLVNLQFFLLDICGRNVSILLTYGISFHIGSTRRHSAPNTMWIVGMQFTETVHRQWFITKFWRICNFFYLISLDGMSAHVSHTVSHFILEAHGGIVLPILWIVVVQFTGTVHQWWFITIFWRICNFFYLISLDGMSAHFSHTVSHFILEAHGGIVLPILWIVGMQFTETVHRQWFITIFCWICNFFYLISLDWHVNILLPYGISFYIGSTWGHSAHNIVDSVVQFTETVHRWWFITIFWWICNFFYLITLDGMSAYFSHTVSNFILEAHGGIVLPILWIVGVQFTETVQR